MFKYCGRSKRKLYSILTIIVLVFTSAGGIFSGTLHLASIYAGDEGILITIEPPFIKTEPPKCLCDPRMGDWRTGITLEEYMKQDSRGGFFIRSIDGIDVRGKVRVQGKPVTEGSVWAELTPGQHDVLIYLAISEKFHSILGDPFWKQDQWEWHLEFVVEKNCVYEVIHEYHEIGTTGIEGYPQTIRPLYGNPKVIRWPHHYDSKTGFATHPTDSKLSFKVK